MRDLELLDADLVGFDPLDLVKALPGVLKGTGQIVKADEDKKKAAAQPAPPAATPRPAPRPAPAAQASPKPEGVSLPWKVGGAAAAFGLLVYVLRR